MEPDEATMTNPDVRQRILAAAHNAIYMTAQQRAMVDVVALAAAHAALQTAKDEMRCLLSPFDCYTNANQIIEKLLTALHETGEEARSDQPQPSSRDADPHGDEPRELIAANTLTLLTELYRKDGADRIAESVSMGANALRALYYERGGTVQPQEHAKATSASAAPSTSPDARTPGETCSTPVDTAKQDVWNPVIKLSVPDAEFENRLDVLIFAVRAEGQQDLKHWHLCADHQPDRWEAADGECPLCEGHDLRARCIAQQAQIARLEQALTDAARAYNADVERVEGLRDVVD
jgi:hypothetical protein